MNKWLNQFLEKPDISDRFGSNVNMSDLSGSSRGRLEENLRNMSETGPDISDRFDSNVNMSGLSGSLGDIFERIVSPYGKHDFEERIAIAEVDGNQNPIQAHRIAYLDAFISLLSALAEDDPYQDWLAQKIQTALATLEAQSFPTLN